MKTNFIKFLSIIMITLFGNVTYAQTNLPTAMDSGPFIPFTPPAGLPSVDAPKMVQQMPEVMSYNGFMSLNGVIYVIFNNKSYSLKDSFEIDGKEWTIDKYTDKHIIMKHKRETKKIALQP